jgi:hypothetical protein
VHARVHQGVRGYERACVRASLRQFISAFVRARTHNCVHDSAYVIVSERASERASDLASVRAARVLVVCACVCACSVCAWASTVTQCCVYVCWHSWMGVFGWVWRACVCARVSTGQRLTGKWAVRACRVPASVRASVRPRAALGVRMCVRTSWVLGGACSVALEPSCVQWECVRVRVCARVSACVCVPVCNVLAEQAVVCACGVRVRVWGSAYKRDGREGVHTRALACARACRFPCWCASDGCLHAQASAEVAAYVCECLGAWMLRGCTRALAGV